MLLKNGYKVKVLNTINFKKSMHYNPFAYIRSEKDILKLVNTIIVNTRGEGQQSGEDFWVKAEKLYYTALIGYIWYECVELRYILLPLHTRTLPLKVVRKKKEDFIEDEDEDEEDEEEVFENEDEDEYDDDFFDGQEDE